MPKCVLWKNRKRLHRERERERGERGGERERERGGGFKLVLESAWVTDRDSETVCGCVSV